MMKKTIAALAAVLILALGIWWAVESASEPEPRDWTVAAEPAVPARSGPESPTAPAVAVRSQATPAPAGWEGGVGAVEGVVLLRADGSPWPDVGCWWGDTPQPGFADAGLVQVPKDALVTGRDGAVPLDRLPGDGSALWIAPAEGLVLVWPRSALIAGARLEAPPMAEVTVRIDGVDPDEPVDVMLNPAAEDPGALHGDPVAAFNHAACIVEDRSGEPGTSHWICRGAQRQRGNGPHPLRFRVPAGALWTILAYSLGHEVVPEASDHRDPGDVLLHATERWPTWEFEIVAAGDGTVMDAHGIWFLRHRQGAFLDHAFAGGRGRIGWVDMGGIQNATLCILLWDGELFSVRFPTDFPLDRGPLRLVRGTGIAPLVLKTRGDFADWSDRTVWGDVEVRPGSAAAEMVGAGRSVQPLEAFEAGGGWPHLTEGGIVWRMTGEELRLASLQGAGGIDGIWATSSDGRVALRKGARTFRELPSREAPDLDLGALLDRHGARSAAFVFEYQVELPGAPPGQEWVTVRRVQISRDATGRWWEGLTTDTQRLPEQLRWRRVRGADVRLLLIPLVGDIRDGQLGEPVEVTPR